MPANALERQMRRWLAYWHGIGEPHQHEFFRCSGCRGLVTWHCIRSGGCPCRSSFKMQPAWLSWSEKLRLLVLPTTVTSAPRRREALARVEAIRLRAAASLTP